MADMVPLVARVDRDVMEALRLWAADEDRSMAGQVRKALRDGIPDKYFEDG
jgi:hypothetical protein